MRKLIASASVVILILAMSITSYATNVEVSTSYDDNDQRFYDNLTNVFQGTGQVFDSLSNDVTSEFIADTSEYMQEKNYGAIVTYITQNDIARIEVWSMIETRSYLTSNYSKTCYHFVTQDGGLYDGKTWMFEVTASGTCVWEDGYQQYYSFGIPTISVAFGSLGSSFTGSLVSAYTTSVVMSDNNRTASFTTTTVHSVYGPSVIPMTSICLGEYTHESNFSFSGP